MDVIKIAFLKIQKNNAKRLQKLIVALQDSGFLSMRI